MARRHGSEDRDRYEVLDRMLRERQSDIRSKLRSLRELLPDEMGQVKDAEEQSMQDFVSSMDFALMEMESETLRKIDDALLRLEEGSYGLCSECEERISEARLKALPFATRCRDCQQREEESGRTLHPRLAFEEEQGGGRGRRPQAEKLPLGAASVLTGVAKTLRMSRSY